MKFFISRRFSLAVLSIFYVAALGTSAVAGENLRPLTTDRPDLTESPFTVNAGHFQVESTILGYTESRADRTGNRDESFEFATTNVRIGLTNRSELNLAWQPYGTVKRQNRGRAQNMNEDGVGSVQIRAKINLLGNDDFEQVGDTALALLPFVTLPTDRDNGISARDVEAGIIIPFAVVLPMKFGLGLNAGISAVHDGDGKGFDAEVFLSAALAYEWTPRFGTYTEVAATLRAENPSADTVLLGTGFTYALRENTQLDGGINFGLTEASDRWAPFVGLTRRF